MKVLFIAKNIPRPSTNTNKIILTLADKLSEFCSITILRPRERIPFWLKNSKKFGDLYGLKGWKYKEYKITTYPYIHLPIKKGKYWLLNKLSKTGNKFIQQHSKFDIVHAHYLFPDGYIAYQIYKKYNIPFVITFRNQDKQYLELISHKNIDYRKTKKILRSAKQVIVPNGGYHKFISTEFNIKSIIIPHGIEKLVSSDSPKNISGELTIISVADTLATKNVDWVINAFKKYSGELKIKLKLVGDVCSRKDIKILARNDDRIKLIGKIPREEVISIMQMSDIFALPSSKETFGLVYLEAAATRNAIIGFKGEGVWGVFEDSNEILFCNNYNEFEKQLHQLINDQSLRKDLTENTFRKAQTMEWSKIQETYKQVYQKTTNQGF